MLVVTTRVEKKDPIYLTGGAKLGQDYFTKSGKLVKTDKKEVDTEALIKDGNLLLDGGGESKLSILDFFCVASRTATGQQIGLIGFFAQAQISVHLPE